MNKTYPLLLAAALCVGLAACGTRPPWTKQGASPEQTSADFSDCRSQAQSVIRRDVNIDTDIAAGRRGDWSKSQTLNSHMATDASADNALSRGIVTSCMESKGYAPSGSGPEASPRLFNFLSF